MNAAFDMAEHGQRFGVRKDWPLPARILDKALAAISEDRQTANFQRRLPMQIADIQPRP